MPFGFNSLQGRIFSVFILLLMLLQCIAAYLVYNSSREDFEQQTQQRLQTGQRLFINELGNRNSYLKKNVSTISQDWAFRSAVGQRDAATIRSTLINHSRRIDADLALFITDDRQLLVNTGETISTTDVNQLLDVSDQSKQQRLMVISPSGGLYQLVVTPVKTPLPIGWLIVGFAIDETLASYFSELSALDVSFIIGSNGLNFVASVMPSSVQTDLQGRSINPISNASQTLSLGPQSENYLLQAFPLPNDMNLPAHVLLAASLAELEASFRASLIDLLLLLIAGSALCALLAYFIAQTVSQPVRKLLAATSNIRAGHYDNAIPVTSSDEVGQLSTEFNRMQLAILQREQEIRYRTIHDDVTPLLNRQGFIDATAHYLAEHPQQALLVGVVELQNFRQVNETLGHSTGDQVLAEAAQRLLSLFSKQHLAHLGSGKFAYLLSDMDTHSSSSVHDILMPAFDLQQIQVTIGAHIGYALFPDHCDDAQSLLRKADIALNIGTEKHQAITAYDPANDQNSVFRLSLLHELRNAIELDRMVLHYQPKLCLNPGPNHYKVTQVECLIRMYHSDGNMVRPDHFIPIAEQSGAICELTEWVLNTALKQCRYWRDQGLELAIAVNISALDLTNGRLPQLVPELLERYQLPPELLILEVTESTLAEDPEQALSIMEALRTYGIDFSIDDYGTGYSSLAQLKQIPARELKIDQAFVRDIHSNNDDPLIVRSTIEMAHGLQMTTTAEGVEDEAALALLESYGCDYAQGYFIAKPMTSEDFNQWQTQSIYPVCQSINEAGVTR